MTEEIDGLIKIVAEILETIDSDKSNLEYGYSWKQNLLRDADIPRSLKNKLGLWPIKCDKCYNRSAMFHSTIGQNFCTKCKSTFEGSKEEVESFKRYGVRQISWKPI